ncbi:MAG TPA: tetratricopeptide repeat protein [Candidatus Angelobacter sp.]|nr:tetratricopeptide repeat protein [Candidatus Angelobacter sp.]
MEELPPNLGSNLPELAKELYRTGLDCHREGKFMQGIEALERSLATYQQLANKGPEDYLHDRFQVWFKLSQCYRATKRTQEAIWSFGESLKIVRQLAAADPDYYLRWVAMTLFEFASLHQDIGQEKEAEAQFLEAMNIYRQLGQINPDFHAHMGEVLMNLGDLYLKQKKYQAAEPACLEALQIARTRNFMAPKGGLLDYPSKVLSDLGHIHNCTGRIPQAEYFYSEAISFSRRLAEENPFYAGTLATNLQNMGCFYGATQRLSDAEPFFDRALELLRVLCEKSPRYLPGLGMVLENLIHLYDRTGRPAQAEAARRELEAIARAQSGS